MSDLQGSWQEVHIQGPIPPLLLNDPTDKRQSEKHLAYDTIQLSEQEAVLLVLVCPFGVYLTKNQRLL